MPDLSQQQEKINHVDPALRDKFQNNDVVLIDNYDSFTWNLYQYLCLLGAKVTVYRSEQITPEELGASHPDLTHLVISPGPGHPTTDSGNSMAIIAKYAGHIPILGVCLGLQCIYTWYGGVIDVAGEIVHGKTSPLIHDGRGLYTGLSQDVACTRYHSLSATSATLPDVLEFTSKTESDIVMGLRHKTFTIEGVQYHPESILSEEGDKLLANFLALRGGTWAEDGHISMEATNEQAGAQPGAPRVRSTANGAATGVTAAGRVGRLAAAGAAGTAGAAGAAGAVAAVAATSTPGKSNPTILEKIYAQRALDVASAKTTPGRTPKDLSALLDLHLAPPAISFYDRLRSQPMALLAEIKRASPSKGALVGPDAPASPQIALQYARAGAAAISVLTEPTWFRGSLFDMRAVRDAIGRLPDRPAVLRKDFIFDTYQIDEARLYGADSVLLIVAMLTDAELETLYTHATCVRGIEPLVEVNNASELQRALAVGAKIIGVNNRNLHDFTVDMGTTSDMAKLIAAQAAQVVLVALSGITSRTDVAAYAEQGVSGILVGESLMRAPDKVAFARGLLGLETTSPAPAAPTAPLVKICGIRSVDAALAAAAAGADMLGFIFVKRSKRYVSTEDVGVIVRAVRAAAPPSAAALASQAAPNADWFALSTHALAVNATRHRPLFVGVFQDAPLSEILDTVAAVGLDAVQLHGKEAAELARFIPVPVIRAFHVSTNDAGAAASATSAESAANAEVTRPSYHAVSLLDTALPSGTSGGAGVAFDWSVVDGLVTGADGARVPFVLAGGLNPENVSGAIRAVKPWAVDVSGGVETDGVKDLTKIRVFVETAKSARL